MVPDVASLCANVTYLGNIVYTETYMDPETSCHRRDCVLCRVPSQRVPSVCELGWYPETYQTLMHSDMYINCLI